MLHSANNPWEEDICDEMQFLSHLKKITVQKGPNSVEGFLVRNFPFWTLNCVYYYSVPPFIYWTSLAPSKIGEYCIGHGYSSLRVWRE